MRTFKRLGALLLVTVLAFGLLPVASAQDDMSVVCDSTLVTLLLIAEHDYGYLSHMLGDEMAAPNIDYGQFSHLINDIVSQMQTMGMSEEAMATAESMQMTLDTMLGMSTNEILHSYDMAMMSDGMGEETMMTVLTPGKVAGENELCTSLRADVEKFIVAHIVAETQAIATGDM